MKEYRLTGGSATVYDNKEEIESVIKKFVKNKEYLKGILSQWCLSNGYNSDLCILFKSDKTNKYLAIFRTYLGGAEAIYTLTYGYDIVIYVEPNSKLVFINLINEFFEKNEEFILPYQKEILNRTKTFDRIFIPLLSKNVDLINAKISKKYFWLYGQELVQFMEVDGGKTYIPFFNEVSKEYFICLEGKSQEVQIFFDKAQATNYALNILTNRLNSKISQVEDLKKRINNLKNID